MFNTLSGDLEYIYSSLMKEELLFDDEKFAAEQEGVSVEEIDAICALQGSHKTVDALAHVHCQWREESPSSPESGSGDPTGFLPYF